jgi:hypothetical protein
MLPFFFFIDFNGFPIWMREMVRQQQGSASTPCEPIQWSPRYLPPVFRNLPTCLLDLAKRSSSHSLAPPLLALPAASPLFSFLPPRNAPGRVDRVYDSTPFEPPILVRTNERDYQSCPRCSKLKLQPSWEPRTHQLHFPGLLAVICTWAARGTPNYRHCLLHLEFWHCSPWELGSCIHAHAEGRGWCHY